jgi:hypothetical protein
VDNFQPYIIAHHVEEDVVITRLTRHVVKPHDANWRHDEIVRMLGTTATRTASPPLGPSAPHRSSMTCRSPFSTCTRPG